MKFGSGIGAIIPFAVLLAGSALAAGNGRIEIEDGVPHVINTESPTDGVATVDLRELWRVGGDDEEILFGVIVELLHDDAGNIYVLDSQLSEIQVFDPAGNYLRTLGREGEGPGEFRIGTDMFWTPDGELAVVQAWPGKIVGLTRDGAPGAAYPLPFRDGIGFQAASRGAAAAGRVVLSGSAWTNEDGRQMQLTYLKAYDADRNEVASFHETASETRFGGWEFQEEDFADYQRRWAVAPDGRVAAALPFADYQITIWNPDGSVQRIIERPDYEPVRRTEDEMQLFQTLYDRFTAWNPGSTFEVNAVHPTVNQITFREDGSLWVQNSRDMWRAAEGIFTAFDVYDREGRYRRRVELRADADAAQDGLFFVGDRVYVVTDLFSAVMASVGGEEETDLAAAAEPVEVIAYAFDAPVLVDTGTN